MWTLPRRGNDATARVKTSSDIPPAPRTPTGKLISGMPRTLPNPDAGTGWGMRFADSSGYRQDVDGVLKIELGPLYVGIRHFRQTYFGRVAGLETGSETVSNKCMGGGNPLFSRGRVERMAEKCE